MQLRVAVHVHILDLLSLPRASLSVEQFNTGHKHAQLCMLSRSCGNIM